MRKILTMIMVLIICGASVFIPSVVLAQGGSFTGRVTDANGTGIAGITIQLRGTTLGTSTSNDGSFTLNAGNRTTGVLDVSGVGSGNAAFFHFALSI